MLRLDELIKDIDNFITESIISKKYDNYGWCISDTAKLHIKNDCLNMLITKYNTDYDNIIYTLTCVPFGEKPVSIYDRVGEINLKLYPDEYNRELEQAKKDRIWYKDMY